MRNVLTEFRENEEKRKKKYNRRSNYEDSYGSYNFEIDSSPGPYSCSALKQPINLNFSPIYERVIYCSFS